MNRRKIQKVLNRFWQSGDNLEKEIIHIDDEKDLINDLFALYGVSHQREQLGCNVKNCYRKGDKHKDGYIYCDRHKPKA